MRILPDMTRKTDFGRNVPSPNSNGWAIWEYPTVWTKGNTAGVFHAVEIPKLEERVSRSTWETFRRLESEGGRASGDDTSKVTPKPSRDAYQSGIGGIQSAAQLQKAVDRTWGMHPMGFRAPLWV